MKARKKVFCVLFFLCVITKAEVRDAHLSCTFTAATEKETAKLDYAFAENVDLNMLTQIRVTLDGKQGDVLNCVRQDVRVTCRNRTDGVESEGLMDRHLILEFPNLTSDLHGVYKLLAVVNATSLDPVNCTVSIAEQNVAGNESKETKVSVGLIIGIVVGLFIITLIIILVIVGLKRGFKCFSGRNTDGTSRTAENQDQEVKESLVAVKNAPRKNLLIDESPNVSVNVGKAIFDGKKESEASTTSKARLQKLPLQERETEGNTSGSS